MTQADDLLEIFEEFSLLEGKIGQLTVRIGEIEARFDQEISRLSHELQSQKNYYSAHIKELYKRSQVNIK